MEEEKIVKSWSSRQKEKEKEERIKMPEECKVGEEGGEDLGIWNE